MHVPLPRSKKGSHEQQRSKERDLGDTDEGVKKQTGSQGRSQHVETTTEDKDGEKKKTESRLVHLH